jgi:hypothetical protein
MLTMATLASFLKRFCPVDWFGWFERASIINVFAPEGGTGGSHLCARTAKLLPTVNMMAKRVVSRKFFMWVSLIEGFSNPLVAA